MQKDPTAKSGGWSEIVTGVAGRLRIEFEDLDPGLRYAVYLELANSGLDSVAVSNQPKINAELSDSQLRPVSTSGQAGNEFRPVQEWLEIPAAAQIAFRVDMRGLGVPTREHRVVLLAIGGNAWELRPGNYSLTASAEFHAETDGPPNQWTGELKLPPVEVEVTDDMFSE
jgi:hypothetical protein